MTDKTDYILIGILIGIIIGLAVGGMVIEIYTPERYCIVAGVFYNESCEHFSPCAGNWGNLFESCTPLRIVKPLW